VLAALAAIAFTQGAWPLTRGEAAPACSARLLDGDRSVRLADYRGQVVYLDFWASWCGPCRESFPFMNELQHELAGKGLQILAVSVDKTAEEARGFLARYPAQFATALDTAGACPAAFHIEGMPTSFVIGRDGVVRAVHVGFRSGDKAEIRRQVSEALSESK
jgi:thiol-disulfide isomerase/thioredoxin